MAIIKITTADVLKSRILEAGWYGAKITAIAGPKASKNGDSINFDFDFTLDEKSIAPGKVVTRVFNSKAIGMVVPVVAAIRNAAVDPKDFDLDTDECLYKSLDVKLTVDIYEGQPKNVASEFAPYGKGTDQKLPF